jgi:CRP-like cAMP-binding protein
MKNQISKQISIARHIVDGSLTIDSVKEFRSILRIFPSDPALHRLYADLLARKKSVSAAMASYSRAATLYIESGMMLQAVVCKILEWRLKAPTRQEARRFYLALNGGKHHETPLNVFFNRLSFSEFAAFINRLKRVQVPAGKTIKKIGEQEKFLYFIAAGNLMATTLHPLAEGQEEPETSKVHLTENDFFGDIYPFKSDKISQSYFETTTVTELIEISRTALKRICKKFPNIELGVIDLLKARSNADDEEILRKVRQTDRQIVPIKIDMQIYPGKSGDHPKYDTQTERSPGSFCGYTKRFRMRSGVASLSIWNLGSCPPSLGGFGFGIEQIERILMRLTLHRHISIPADFFSHRLASPVPPSDLQFRRLSDRRFP